MAIRTSKQLWKNHQWAVTTYGLECLGPDEYPIEKKRLTERRPGSPSLGDWPLHMAEKNWVDIAAFNEAYVKALEIHKPKDAATIDLPETLKRAVQLKQRG